MSDPRVLNEIQGNPALFYGRRNPAASSTTQEVKMARKTSTPKNDATPIEKSTTASGRSAAPRKPRADKKAADVVAAIGGILDGSTDTETASDDLLEPAAPVEDVPAMIDVDPPAVEAPAMERVTPPDSDAMYATLVDAIKVRIPDVTIKNGKKFDSLVSGGKTVAYLSRSSRSVRVELALSMSSDSSAPAVADLIAAAGAIRAS